MTLMHDLDKSYLLRSNFDIIWHGSIWKKQKIKAKSEVKFCLMNMAGLQNSLLNPNYILIVTYW